MNGAVRVINEVVCFECDDVLEAFRVSYDGIECAADGSVGDKGVEWEVA